MSDHGGRFVRRRTRVGGQRRAERGAAGVATPDVTVVVAVYNTMPYLTRCLRSLAEQSIGLERLEVIAVDDGSTDGSGAELDRFARRYPHTFTVIHQANCGGPAAPCNRALERATGRYVFFLGADDYLGREALERLVAAADRLGSDVVLGRAVGVNGRHVDQAVFAADATDIGLFDSALPYALANTKLFRRELIERHGLRYPEQMRVCSDQPFTLEACLHARRISVLADYDYYYAVRRLNSLNITYGSRHAERLKAVEELVAFIAALVPPGERRDALLVRHFRWEFTKLLGDGFRRLDRDVQGRLVEGIGALVRAHLTEGIRRQLDAESRVRFAVAAHGHLDALLAVIGQDAEVGVPPTVVEGDRWYAAYPGFRGPWGLPDECFDVTGTADWAAKLDATALAWRRAADGRRVLAVRAHTRRSELAGPVAMLVGDVTGSLEMACAASGTDLVALFPVDELLATSSPRGERRALRVTVGAGTAPLRAPRFPTVVPLIRRRGARLYVVSLTKDQSGQIMLGVTPVTPRRVVAHLRPARPPTRKVGP
jgi:poly(ribitol-phosphate) beta-N-acetylglucosaminyltransferase